MTGKGFWWLVFPRVVIYWLALLPLLLLAACGAEEPAAAGPAAAAQTAATAAPAGDATITAAAQVIAQALAGGGAPQPSAEAVAAATLAPAATPAPAPAATATSASTSTPSAVGEPPISSTPTASMLTTPALDLLPPQLTLQQQIATSVAATVAALPVGADSPPPATATPEPTATVQPAPTSTAIILRTAFYPISLQTAANASTEEGYVNPPLGPIQLGGVPFSLPSGRNSITTQAEPLPDYPRSVQLSVGAISGVEAVHLLLTGGITRNEYRNIPVGQVVLRFDRGAHVVDLVPGYNLREWKIYGDQNVTNVTDVNIQEVWRTTNTHDDGMAVIDMLTIPIPARLTGDSLVAIEILDNSEQAVGSRNPAINILGVTVVGH